MISNIVTGKSENFSTKMDPNDLQRYNPPANAALYNLTFTVAWNFLIPVSITGKRRSEM